MKSTEFDVAVFDCDGVVLDSNRVKVEAFRWALRNERQDLTETLIEYHRKNGGISRQEKLGYFFDKLVGRRDDEKFGQALVDFASYCRENLPQCRLIPGIREFLYTLQCPKYVVTGGDESEVRVLLGAHGLLALFEDVLGGPTPKITQMDRLAASGCLTGRGIYFGDARLDQELARKHGLAFVFVWGASDWVDGMESCRALGVPVLPDFTDASAQLTHRFAVTD